MQTDQLMNHITSPLPEEPIESSEENTIGQEIAKEEKVIEVTHIDFIFGNQPLKLEDYMQMAQIQ